MPARAATPFDAPRISTLLAHSLRAPDCVIASALPTSFAGGAVPGVWSLGLGLVGLGAGRLRVYLDEYRGQLRSVALVYDGKRPEWVILMLATMPEPGGADSAFRLVSGISGAAARAGMRRRFAAVPAEAAVRISTEALLSGEATILIPAASASTGLLLINAGLLRYVYRFDRDMDQEHLE